MKKLIAFVMFACVLFPISFCQAQDPLESQAEIALVSAQVDIKEMQLLGLSAAYASDLLVVAQKAFDGDNLDLLLTKARYLNNTGKQYQAQEIFNQVFRAQESGSKINANYSLVLLKTNEIREHKLFAQELYSDLEALDSVLYSLNSSPFNLTAAWQARENAHVDFKSDRLEDSRSWLNDSYFEIDDAKASYSYVQVQIDLAKNNFGQFLKDNWIALLVVVILFVVFGWFANAKLQARLLASKIRDLEKEQETLHAMLKKAQEDYFLGKKISRQAFELKKKQYGNRLTEIKSALPVLKDRLNKKLEKK
jgi:hypothetical protein